MSETLHNPRILKETFEDALHSGLLEPLLALVRRDRDLIAEIRTDCLDIYCKGNRLAGVRPLSDGGYELESHQKFWPEKRMHISSQEQVAKFCKTLVPFMKQSIAEHSSQGKEIEFEQMLIRANNLEALNSDYIAVDRQGVAEEGKGRTDVVGVYWPGNSRNRTTYLSPALIEVKYGLHGGVEGIAEQVERYYNSLASDINHFCNALEMQLRQKARLKLLSGLSIAAQAKIQTLPISTKLQDLRIVIALVDYNPKSSLLDLGKLKALPFASQIDVFNLGFGMWHLNRLVL